MDQLQKNHRKMYSNVLAWFDQAGQPLLPIIKIKALVNQAIAQVKALDEEAKRQPPPTTNFTRTRTTTKKETAEKAEALRGLAAELTTDAKLRAALAKPVSDYFYRDEAGFLAYCQQVAEAIPTLAPKELQEAGYDAQVLAVLTTDLHTLTTTTSTAGLQRTAATAVTDALPALFTAVDTTLASLDKFMGFQALAQGELVQQYVALRRLPKTPAHHAYRAKGPTPFGVPQLLFNVLEADVPTPTLYNIGSRGHEVVFYLGATPTSHPRPGQGVALKNGKSTTIADYAALGTPATEPYLLVLQTSELGPGGWRVKG